MIPEPAYWRWEHRYVVDFVETSDPWQAAWDGVAYVARVSKVPSPEDMATLGSLVAHGPRGDQPGASERIAQIAQLCQTLAIAVQFTSDRDQYSEISQRSQRNRRPS